MTKIATKSKCNVIESGSFLGDLLVCPTYEEIINTDKFNVTGTYENNQLVKESDITKYSGKTKNYSYIWGEWDLTKKSLQANNSVNILLKQNFLNAPDTNLTINVTFNVKYKASIYVQNISTTAITKTINFTQTTGSDKKYAYTQEFNLSFGTTSRAVFESITISNVIITPSKTSLYNYITNIKDITQNFFINALSVSYTSFYIDSYNDNATNKTITNNCRLIPKFTIPTGTGVNNITIYVDNNEYNYSQGISIETTTSPSNNLVIYNFSAVDNYGERGYKLPYFYTKFTIEHTNNSYKSFVYAIWNPTSSQTGIELTSLILDE